MTDPSGKFDPETYECAGACEWEAEVSGIDPTALDCPDCGEPIRLKEVVDG